MIICCGKRSDRGGVSSIEGNFGHFLQFWGVFSPLHPPKVLTLPNSVWNAYQPSFWMQQDRFDQSGRDFFIFFHHFWQLIIATLFWPNFTCLEVAQSSSSNIIWSVTSNLCFSTAICHYAVRCQSVVVLLLRNLNTSLSQNGKIWLISISRYKTSLLDKQ